MKLKVKDQPGLIRDSNSKAIVVEDRDAYNAYIHERHMRNKVFSAESEIANIKDELGEIKALLNTIISRTINNN